MHSIGGRFSMSAIAAIVGAFQYFLFPNLASPIESSGYTLQFVSRPPQAPVGGHGVSFFGHAFLIVGVRTSHGTREEIFGFYPTSNNMRGIVKGPGLLRADDRCGPSDDCKPANRAALLRRLSESEASVTIPISEQERRGFYRQVKIWDSQSTIGPDDRQIIPSSDREYRLADQNCIDFLVSVATALGYPTPARNQLQTPMEFLRAFKPVAEQERRNRAAEQQATEAERRAAVADRRRQEAERRADAAERQAAGMIPAGWVECTCPAQHRSLGRVVNGKIYHAPNINCSP